MFFPEPVPGPDGRPAYAMLHRPMWDLGWIREGEGTHLPAGVTDDRPGHLDLLRARRATSRATSRALVATCATTGCVALPRVPVRGQLKIGAGPPPVRVARGLAARSTTA